MPIMTLIPQLKNCVINSVEVEDYEYNIIMQ